MSAQQEESVGLAALEQAIKQGIMQRTCGRIQRLQVDIDGEHIVVGGQAASFHLKQLAIQGIFDVIGPASRQRVEANIQVIEQHE